MKLNLGQKKIVFSFLASLLVSIGTAQKDQSFIQFEYQIGHVAPNYRNFPKSSILNAVQLNFAKFYSEQDQDWKNYFDHPLLGVSIGITDFGQAKLFGQQIYLTPFFSLKTGDHPFKNMWFRFGLGPAIHTRKYSISNVENVSIGSTLNWAFTASLHKYILSKKNFALQLGISYLHASNAHVQLPNYGLNSGVVSLIYQTKGIQQWTQSSMPAYQFPRTNYFIHISQGLGLHELGGTERPIGGKKFSIHSVSICTGIQWRAGFKWRAGFTYRYYPSYANYIIQQDLKEFQNKLKWNASSIHFLLGFEFLFGHFGADLEGGLTLSKPFYPEFSRRFEKYGNFKYWLKYLFPSHLQMNYYLFNTTYRPKNNYFIGANISANFGQADFSELVIGYQKNLSRKKAKPQG